MHSLLLTITNYTSGSHAIYVSSFFVQSSLDDLSKGPRHMRTPSNDFICSQSIESINSQGQV